MKRRPKPSMPFGMRRKRPLRYMLMTGELWTELRLQKLTKLARSFPTKAQRALTTSTRCTLGSSKKPAEIQWLYSFKRAKLSA